SPPAGLGKPALAGVMFAAGMIVGAGLGATLAPREIRVEHARSPAVATEAPQATESALGLAAEKAPPSPADGNRAPAPPARRRAPAPEVAPDPSTAERRADRSTAE